MSIRSEIFEQPERLMNLLVRQRPAIEEIARAIRERGIQWIFLAARGTSDNAGRYANYLLGGAMACRWRWRRLRCLLIISSLRA